MIFLLRLKINNKTDFSLFRAVLRKEKKKSKNCETLSSNETRKMFSFFSGGFFEQSRELFLPFDVFFSGFSQNILFVVAREARWEGWKAFVHKCFSHPINYSQVPLEN